MIVSHSERTFQCIEKFHSMRWEIVADEKKGGLTEVLCHNRPRSQASEKDYSPPVVTASSYVPLVTPSCQFSRITAMVYVPAAGML